MSTILESISAHSEGEHPTRDKESWPLDTPGGRFYAEWDTQAPTSREGQLIFFFQFLEAGGRWEEFMKYCPLNYSGNRGSGALNVMGTILLSVLCGHWRYAHINSVRGDGINPGLLGMERTVSEDAVRAAMKRIPEKAGLDWLRVQILESISGALILPWILDIDTTVKPLYGHQQGAELGYNRLKSRAAPATFTTATSLRTCGSASGWKRVPATNIAPLRAWMDCGKHLRPCHARDGQLLPEEIVPMETRG